MGLHLSYYDMSLISGRPVALGQPKYCTRCVHVTSPRSFSDAHAGCDVIVCCFCAPLRIRAVRFRRVPLSTARVSVLVRVLIYVYKY